VTKMRRVPRVVTDEELSIKVVEAVKRLPELIRDTNYAIQVAADAKINDWVGCSECKYAAIDWSDVECTNAMVLIDKDRDVDYQVYIVGATAEAYNFKRFITKKLEELGWKNVVIFAEW